METESKRWQVIHSCECSICEQHPYSRVAKEHRTINRLVAGADERNRRLLAGFLAQQRGRGGVALLARVTGLSRRTILRGRRELQQARGTANVARIRRKGGGRKRVEKKARRL